MKQESKIKEKLKLYFPQKWRESREDPYRNTPHYLANAKVLFVLGTLVYVFVLGLIQLVYVLFFYTSQNLQHGIYTENIPSFWETYFSYPLFLQHSITFILLSLIVGGIIAFLTIGVHRSYFAMEDLLTAGTNSFETRRGIYQTYPFMFSLDETPYDGPPGVPLAHFSMEELVSLQDEDQELVNKEKKKLARRSKLPFGSRAEKQLEKVIMKEQKNKQELNRVPFNVLSDEAFADKEKFWLALGTEITNVCCIGITRSGKKVFFAAPVLDSFSRPVGKYDKASFIVTDLKGELLLENYTMLKKRGYLIRVLNLINTYQSSAYNPLQLVVEAYQKFLDPDGKYTEVEKSQALDSAQKILNTIAFTFYENPDAKEPFWGDNAQLLFVACALVLVEQGIKTGTEDKITIYSLATMVNEMRSDEILSTDHPYLQEFVSETQTEEALFRKYKKQNTLDMFFGELPAGHPSKILYATIKAASKADSTIGAIAAHLFSGLKSYLMRGNATLTSQNEFDLEDIGFGERPTAVFLVIPDQDKSNHALATFFIDQSYKVLTDKAFLESEIDNKRKCKRPVVYLLDEMGNLPLINDLDSKLTACLGRNIRFFIILQSFTQLDKYPEGLKDTILSNCGYMFYIKSPDETTNKMISGRLGNRRVWTMGRQGKFFSLFKQENESLEEKELLNVTELEQLQFGENVILRIMTNEDKEGNEITAYPILNRGKNRFKRHYTYMQGYKEMAWEEIPEVNGGGHTKVQLEDLVTTLDPNVIFLDEMRRKKEGNLMPETSNDGITAPSDIRAIEKIQIEREKALYSLYKMTNRQRKCTDYYNEATLDLLKTQIKKTIIQEKAYRDTILSMLLHDTLENFIQTLLPMKSQQHFTKILQVLHKVEQVA
ncbi:type IV secretory system conjugative DNA transfer family protein [Listeria welshimeri]|nr:type IV secretory system conjugative DNA transfer family protein [Listeria welshimeri]MBC2344574.1 type IV secretory system conjugative DNA transfer family protein [Listeria welshimeri]